MTSSQWPSNEDYAAWGSPPATFPSFADFYAETFDRSVAHVQRRFHVSQEIAEEIVQTAFLKQWERNPGFVGVVNPWKFVRTVIAYVALEYLRTNQRSPVLTAISLDQPTATDSSFTWGDSWALQHQGMSVEETVIVREQLRQAADYLHSLPDVQQVLIQMNAAGYSHTEIRAHLHTHYGFQGSLKVIEHRLADSRQQLRQQARVQRQQQRVIRRKRVRKLPSWAAQYVACIVCGTTDIDHRAHGKCRHCYDKERMVKVRQAAKLR